MSNKDRSIIEIIPERKLFAAGREQTADLLIRITPPESANCAKRPLLNLSLVLDRSGSMQGEKIARARAAAAYCIDQLMPQDRVSVVIFDDAIDVLVPSRMVEDREAIKHTFARIHSRNSTALHEAWVRGGMQVSEHLTPGGINRVLLITDGLANVGETNTDRIVSQARSLAERGVTTSTIGIGSDFNEDLLIPMAESAGGSAWHVKEPSDMERIFATELEGLIAQIGHTVSLGLTPSDGVTVQDVMNDFDVTHTGRYKLPNLMAGSVTDVAVRIKLPARPAGQKFHTLDLRLAWNPQNDSSNRREVITESVILEFADEQEAQRSPSDERVTKAVQLLMAARARREAMEHLDKGNIVEARAVVTGTLGNIAMACAPMMSDRELAEEVGMLQELEAEFASEENIGMSRKKLAYQSYQRSRQSRKLT
jgi:Ca-activated chloride channel family protein